MPIYTIRAIFKKFKATGTATNLPGRGPMFILPPRTEADKRGKKIPKDHFYLQRKVTSWGHQVSKTTIRRHFHANKLFGRHSRKKALSCHPTTNVSAWSSLNATASFDLNCALWSDERKAMSFSATNTQGG